ncbi:hypothetical protein DM860_009970 [Cuscuta australis]|uniref:V-SNARE coiled-coil homology domain-containing protein n=1 Tax=Cuscuta australis TaxID=267555 RepID=A0A328DF94_9ASTE|nr:hypothetical protein DM860_009970 [Cuscuta australis]
MIYYHYSGMSIQLRSIMVDNIDRILERGDRIELLVDKTATMQGNSFHFRKQSNRLRRAIWMKNAKLINFLGWVRSLLGMNKGFKRIQLQKMKPIQLPEPPQSPRAIGGMPEIFQSGVYGVIRRAVIIGNGFPASENQSIGLVRALGLYEKHTLYRVTRPRGGINEWLIWLPVSLHKRIYYFVNLIFGYSHFLLGVRGNKLGSFSHENGTVGLSSILEADVKNIVNLARESFDRDGPLLVVASGRDTISIASSIKRLASENVFVIQFAPLPKPLLVVNIGGPSRYCKYGVDLAKQLTTSLHNILERCGSVRISFSRRTPEKMSKTWSYPPLNDTAEAANRVNEALAQRGWMIKA